MRVVAAVFGRFCDEREIPKKENKQKPGASKEAPGKGSYCAI